MNAAQLLTSIIFDNEPVVGRRYWLTNAMDGRTAEAELLGVEQRIFSFGLLHDGKRVERRAAVALFRDSDGAEFEREIVPPLGGAA